MSSGERPIGATKGKQPNTKALCHHPPPCPHEGLCKHTGPVLPHFLAFFGITGCAVAPHQGMWSAAWCRPQHRSLWAGKVLVQL